ncbi:MAG: hypothetical protein IPJ43_14645 [Saprospiraceae bacterium]|nr:hypothetical protein [Saprospiraceae bacterium]
MMNKLLTVKFYVFALTYFLFIGVASAQCPSCTSIDLGTWDFENAVVDKLGTTGGITPNPTPPSSCAQISPVKGLAVDNSTNRESSGEPVYEGVKSICTGSWNRPSCDADRYMYFTVTFPAGYTGKLSELSFYEEAPTKTTAGGSLNNNNYPRQFCVNVFRGSTNIYSSGNRTTSVAIHPSENWALRTFAFSGTNFCSDGSAAVTFTIRIQAFDPASNGGTKVIWETDLIKIKGCCTQACTLTADAGANVTICNGSSTTLNATGSNGSGSYGYSWSSGIGTGRTKTVSPTSTTTYTVTITDNANGCTASDAVTVTVVNKPTANAGSDFTKTCTSNSSGRQIGVSPVSGYSYSWSPTTGLSSSTISNPIANPSNTITYTLTVTSTSSPFCTDTDQVIVTVNNSPPSANAGSDFSITCTQNLNGRQIGTSTTSGYTYLWSPSSGLSSTTLSNPIANPTTTTTYTVTVTNTSNGCTATDQVIVTYNKSIPTVNAGTDFTKTCTTNSSGRQIGTSPTSGYTYIWSPTTGLSSSTISNPNANPSSTTTYVVTVTNTASGCSATDQVTVTVNTTIPTADAGAGFTKSCTVNPNGAQIGASPISGYTYLWSPSAGLSSTTLSNPIANPNTTTTYTLTVTNTSNGCTATDQVIVTVNGSPPVANAGADFEMTCVQNVTGRQIGTSTVSGYSYSWNPSAGLSNTTISNPFANPTTTTTYTVTVTNTSNGCTSTDQVIVTYNKIPPIANAGANFTKSCINNINGKQIGTSSTSGYTYNWNPAVGLSSTIISNPIANPTTTTTYIVTVTNSANGCTATDQIVVTVNNSPPSANAGIDFTKTCSLNPNGAQIGSAPTSGLTYIWDPTTGLSSSTISNPTANPSITTTYSLTVTNSANGCTATDQIIVTVDATLPTANAGTDFTKTCTSNATGRQIGTTAVTGMSYSWSPTSGLSNPLISNPTANPTVTTTYTVTITDTNNGCTDTDQVIVTVNTATPTANAGTDFTKTCTSNATGRQIGTTAVIGMSYS